MALSQKHSGKILVPWFNSHEWKYVYSLLYSDNSTKCDKQKALEILKVWKIRMPILFAGLEGTLIILNAMLQDETLLSQTDLSSFYGLAIMRFLNLCAAYSDQQGTFFRVAKERNLPDWLVNIRHDLAHSQKQLSIFMLRKGLKYCFDWLKREYWEPQDQEMTDLVAPNLISEHVDVMKIYCEFVSTRIAQEKLSMRVKTLLRGLGGNVNSDTNIILQNILNVKFSTKSFIEEVPNLIIEGGYLFTVLSDVAEDIEKIPSLCIEGWQPLMQYMYSNNALMKFIRKLHEICYNNSDDNIQKLSSLWLNEVFKGLLKERGMAFKNESTYVMNFCGADKGFLSELKAFANEAIENPHIYFQNYSVSLMTLCEYNENCINHINNLLVNYFDPREVLVSREAAPFTLENINELVKTDIFEKMDSEQVPREDEECMKIKDTRIYESCPIGVLPLQCSNVNHTIPF